jgi:hypothetical protein
MKLTWRRVRAVGAVVVVWWLVGHAAAAATPRWSVTPPAGWTDHSSEARKRPEVVGQQKVLAEHDGAVEVTEYRGPGGEVLAIVYIHARNEADDASGVEGFEKGAHNSGGKLGPDKSYTRRYDGDTLVVDEVAAGPNGDVYLRRIAGATGSELVGVMGTCVAPKDVCNAALQSLTFDRTGLLPLHDGKDSRSYALGRQVGQVVGFLSMALVALWFLQRSRRKKAAAPPVAGPPQH